MSEEGTGARGAGAARRARRSGDGRWVARSLAETGSGSRKEKRQRLRYLGTEARGRLWRAECLGVGSWLPSRVGRRREG